MAAGLRRLPDEKEGRDNLMGIQLLSLRILHIVFGTFWVGSDAFVTFLLLPRLRALGPDVERAVMGALMRYLPSVMMLSSIVTAVTGVWLAGIMRGWSLGWVLASNSGVAILVGFVGTVAALFVGFGLLPMVTIRYDRLSRSVEARSPTHEEDRQLHLLAAQGTVLARVNSVLLISVVVAMAVTRFV